jgi:hypothetical protein
MIARVLDEAVAGRIALGSSAVATRAERASELELLETLNRFLSQCLSAKAENAMVRNNQLPEWQQKSLSRLPDLYTADPVPNSEKLEGKWRSLRGIKLVPFVCRTGAR